MMLLLRIKIFACKSRALDFSQFSRRILKIAKNIDIHIKLFNGSSKIWQEFFKGSTGQT